MILLNKILPIIVLYEQDYILSKTLITLNKSVNNYDDKAILEVFVYDNGKDKQNVKSYYFENLKIIYIHDKRNLGVSFAYNRGAEKAKELNKEWILILDQDTCISNDSIKKYINSMIEETSIKLFVPILEIEEGKILSPCRYMFKKGFFLKTISKGISNFENKSVVNSGMMINLIEFLKVGGYNEKVFLDHSDFIFINKFKQRNRNFYIIDSVWKQNLSTLSDNFKQEKKRFKLFISSINEIDKEDIISKLSYIFLVLSRGIKLTIKYFKLDFLGIIIANFRL